MLGYVPAPLCIYQNTFKVMPAEVISFGNKITKKNIYYQIPKPEFNKELLYEKCKKELLNTLEESIKKMMIADVEVGCFLSGGIDSTLIAIALKNVSNKKVETFNC